MITRVILVEDIPGGAATCCEGFVYFFSESSPGRWAVLASKGNFKKIYYKTFATSGRPTKYIPLNAEKDASPKIIRAKVTRALV